MVANLAGASAIDGSTAPPRRAPIAASAAWLRPFLAFEPRRITALCLLLAGCGAPRAPGAMVVPAAGSEPPAPAIRLDPGSIIADLTAVEFASETASPRWDDGAPARLPGCPAYERPLVRVARAAAEALARHATAADLSDVTVLLRTLGSPHVWPRLWSMEGRALAEADVLAAWGAWLGPEPGQGERRCGIARIRAADGREVIAAVVVDALADLRSLPLEARTGQWLRLDARPLVAVREARLLLLGPDGASPRSAPVHPDAAGLHASFSLDRAGLWRLQLVLDAGAGPRPALEAWTFVDRDPDLEAVLRAAPGEGQAPPPGAGRDELRAALSQMIDVARRAQGIQPLRRDWALDDLAQKHAEAMSSSGRTAHDVGGGLPTDRVARAGLRLRRVGENVARARSLERAHRALWDSPSHRGNILDPGFSVLGVGVARAESNDVWVCELFAQPGG